MKPNKNKVNNFSLYLVGISFLCLWALYLIIMVRHLTYYGKNDTEFWLIIGVMIMALNYKIPFYEYVKGGPRK